MGKTTDRLIRAANDLWTGYHSHPFVTGIADGSLDKEKFKYYMVQDYLYLFDYARVFALGAAKSQDPDIMRLFADYVNQILNGEMQIHRKYMERLGICLAKAEATPASLDNLSYTSYMLRIAYEGGAAEIMTAILSCAVSYEHIAKYMVSHDPSCAGHPFYGEWIRSYADPAYAKANRTLETLTETLTKDLTEAALLRLEKIFINCSRYEAAFWDMAWEMRP